MKLRALDIQQLPGTGAFRIDDLAVGANLITGPNAVGKSSLIRALRYLIGGPRPGDPVALALSAEFEDADGHWRVQRAGSQLAWTRNGQAAEPPALPDPDLLHCYWLRVEDLLTAHGGKDAELVRQLRNELSGGYDLDALGASAPFDFGPQTGRREAQALQNARRARRDIENAHEALQRESGHLPEMRAEAEAAEAASRRLEQLDRALSLLVARRARLDAEQRLSAFPAGMDRLRGNELTRLAELEGERSDCLKARDEQERARREAAERLAASGLGAERPAAAEFQAHREQLATRGGLTDRLEEENKRLRESRAQEKRAALALGATQALPRLDPECVDEAQDLAGRLHDARRARDDEQARLSALDEDADAAARHHSSAHALWIAALAFVGGLAAGTATVPIPAPWWRLAAAAFLTGAGFWGLVEAGRRWAERRSESDYRGRRRRELEAELERAETALQETEDECQRFCAERGIDPELFEGAGLERYVRLAVDLDRARDARYTAEQAVAAAEARIAETDRSVREFLTRWQAAPEPAGATELKAALEAFERRCQEAGEAQEAQRHAERECARIDDELGRVDEKIAQLYVEAGVEAGARATLEARCEAFDDWRRQRDACNEAVSVEAERRRPLAAEAELLERVEADDAAGLHAEREHVAQQAQDRDRLRDAVLDLEQRLGLAGRESELENAAAEEARAQEALADQFDRAMLAEAGHCLLDGIAAEYRSEHEPAVLQDARERFARFTHHAWSLEVDPEHGFHAIERASDEQRGLTELSSGTRMQLLLAVRMAWARQIEREKTPLPLFLDEALTTSDETRFGEVAASLEQLVADEGRQIFYLSARRQEIALWERATGRAPHVVDLAEVRFGQAAAGADDYAVPAIDPLPAPGDRSAEQYAATLGVPPVDPRGAAAGIHLFHVLRDDLPLLHALMEHWRITHLGALEALLASEAADKAVPDAGMRSALAARCQAARRWTAIWRQGRGKPVDRGVLEASGVISDTFIDRVAELAEELDGDGSALIEALRAGRVPRFRANTTDELAERLRANGHIDPTDPPDADDRERQTLQTAADLGRPEELRPLIRWLERGANAETDVAEAGSAATASA